MVRTREVWEGADSRGERSVLIVDDVGIHHRVRSHRLGRSGGVVECKLAPVLLCDLAKLPRALHGLGGIKYVGGVGAKVFVPEVPSKAGSEREIVMYLEIESPSNQRIMREKRERELV